MICIEINNQTQYKISQGKINKLLNAAQNFLRRKNKESVSLAFISSGAIKKLNCLYRGKNKVTDVLSFEDNEPDSNKLKILGEIIICPEQAKKQSIENHCGFESEIMKLVLHGYLHLLGYDHEKSLKEEKLMMDVEKKILEKIYG